MKILLLNRMAYQKFIYLVLLKLLIHRQSHHEHVTLTKSKVLGVSIFIYRVFKSTRILLLATKCCHTRYSILAIICHNSLILQQNHYMTKIGVFSIHQYFFVEALIGVIYFVERKLHHDFFLQGVKYLQRIILQNQNSIA